MDVTLQLQVLGDYSATAPPGFPLPDGWSATSTGAPMSLGDTNTAGQRQRFYRLEAAYP